MTRGHPADSHHGVMNTTQTWRVEQLLERIQRGPIKTGWHWLGYNFEPGTPGYFLVAVPTARALAVVDETMPGYADEQLLRLESLGGRERELGDYRQIVSWYTELLVIQQLALHAWPAGGSFEMEPTSGQTNHNPEVVVHLGGIGSLAVEVKAPDLLDHAGKRSANAFQLNARGAYPESVKAQATFPRDNPVKDFLIHADKKFAGFRDDPTARSILVVVWDEYLNEPVAALTAPGSGLLTPNSFHRHEGEPVVYSNIDAILLVAHQHQIVEGLANRPLSDGCRNLLDFGRPAEFPHHALISNPGGRPLPVEFLEALHAWPIESLVGSEYSPSELVMWTGVSLSISDHEKDADGDSG